MTNGIPLVLRTAHTHLFRGSRLVPDGSVAAREPAAVRIVFSDGGELDAELLISADGSELALDVPPFRTAAGRDVAAKAWRVARVEPDGVIVLGERLA